jgi:beta-lactam-binding protein with PASTA domain
MLRARPLINRLGYGSRVAIIAIYLFLETIAPSRAQAQITGSTADKAVNILSISGQLDSEPVQESIPIDSTITQAIFQVTGATAISLLRPNGITVTPGDADIRVITQGSSITYRVANPIAGSWEVIISGNGAYQLLVTGYGALDFVKFDFVRVQGRGGHEGLVPVSGAPIVEQTTLIHGVLSGDFRTAQFEFHNPAGDILQLLSMTANPSEATTEFVGSAVPPSEPFLVYVTGIDSNGVEFLRFLPRVINAQTIEVEVPFQQQLLPGQRTAYVFQVTNRGTPNTVLCTASDNRGFVVGVSPATAALGSDETVEVTVELEVPADTPRGSSERLTLLCTIEGLPAQRNSATILNLVTDPALVSMPTVVGLTQEAAQSALSRVGLSVGTVSMVDSSTVPAGTVTSQSPTAGTSVPANSVVDLVVSSSPTTITVPNVVGQNQANAQAAITAAGLSVGTVSMASSCIVPTGVVISQSPSVGTSVAPGSAVDLVVSSGQDTSPPVPDLASLPTVTGECSAQITSIPTATDNCAGRVIGTTSDPLSYSQQGTFTVTWTFNDGNGNTSTQAQTVVVKGVPPPSIQNVFATPNVLWPPNHKMVSVTISVSASATCGATPRCQIKAVRSNEAQNGLGDGDTAPDWQISGDRTVNLRAERSGTGSGRIYTITVGCTDASGNSSTRMVNVTVPHNK